MAIIKESSLLEAIKAYEDCVPMSEIASWYGVSRQGLWKRFKKAGVETRNGIATRRAVICDECGGEYSVTRSRYRNLGKKRFCSDVCYQVYLQNNDSVTNRQMQRMARAKVLEVFDLSDENVVHHLDSNHWNMEYSNLVVFKNQSDHIKYHHEQRQGVEHSVIPVWDGRSFGY